MLVFQSLVIIWCVINCYPARLLKKFMCMTLWTSSVKEKVNMFVLWLMEVSTNLGVLKFSEFEKKWLYQTWPPFWIDAFDVLKGSFLTALLDSTLQEVTQSIFYNPNRKKMNATRVCENFQNKMNAAHRKPKRGLVYEPSPEHLETDATPSPSVEVASSPTNTPRFRFSSSKTVDACRNDCQVPTSKKQLF